MICCNCKRELAAGTKFCIHCGVEQPSASMMFPQQAPDRPISQYSAHTGVRPNKPAGRFILFGAFGTAVGAALLAVLLFITGVFSFGGKTIEGSGFASPEDAANAYLEGLRDRDFDAMLASFAVETYVNSYDFEAFTERLNAYTINAEMRFPNTNEYTKRLNIECRKNWIANLIITQYMQYNTPDAFNNGTVTTFNSPEDISDFVEDFEHDTQDYIFQDLKVLAAVSSQDLEEGSSPEDLAENLLNDVENDLPEDLLEEIPEGALENVLELYMSKMNQESIAKQVKPYGVDIEDTASIVVLFEADGDTWIFCPQAIRYNGRWYLQTLMGNLANLSGMSYYTGGIAPID